MANASRTSAKRLVVNMRDARPSWRIPDRALAEIRSAAGDQFEIVVVDAFTDSRGDGGLVTAAALEAIAGAEVYLGFGFPTALLEAARGSGGALRWVHTGTAGVGGTLYPLMRDSDIVLTNSAGIYAEPMADTVFAMIYYFARGVDLAVAGQRDRRWVNDRFTAMDAPVREIAGSTIGVLGFRGIGGAVASRARALGMRVLAFMRRRRHEVPEVEALYGETGLDQLLRESHYVVVTLPSTPETRGLLDARRIATLRRDAVLINVGRGDLIDEDALAEALRCGAMRGAGLDVFRQEPLPKSSPLWDLPNVLITPHASATSDRYWRRQTDLIVENLRRYSRGEPLLNTVDKQAGY